VGFGDTTTVTCPKTLPPLELRTAYTVKGLGIGAGGLVGYLAFGPLGLVLLGAAGWYAGNRVAVNAERDFTATRKSTGDAS